MPIEVRHEPSAGVISDAAFTVGRGAYAQRAAAQRQQANIAYAQMANQRKMQEASIQAQAERDARQAAFDEAAKRNGITNQKELMDLRSKLDREEFQQKDLIADEQMQQKNLMQHMDDKRKLVSSYGNQQQKSQLDNFNVQRHAIIANKAGAPVAERSRLLAELDEREMQFLELSNVQEPPTFGERLRQQMPKKKWIDENTEQLPNGDMVLWREGKEGPIPMHIKNEERAEQIKVKQAEDKAAIDRKKAEDKAAIDAAKEEAKETREQIKAVREDTRDAIRDHKDAIRDWKDTVSTDAEDRYYEALGEWEAEKEAAKDAGKPFSKSRPNIKAFRQEAMRDNAELKPEHPLMVHLPGGRKVMAKNLDEVENYRQQGGKTEEDLQSMSTRGDPSQNPAQQANPVAEYRKTLPPELNQRIDAVEGKLSAQDKTALAQEAQAIMQAAGAIKTPQERDALVQKINALEKKYGIR